jgi:methanogenic corrinoid protein MtbC1
MLNGGTQTFGIDTLHLLAFFIAGDTKTYGINIVSYMLGSIIFENSNDCFSTLRFLSLL